MPATTAAATTTLRLSRTFRAAPARVYEAWTSPEEMKKWAAPGDMKATIEADFRVGGTYRMDMHAPDGTVRSVAGTYRVIEPPKRVVYTWQWLNSPNFPESVVTVEFKLAPNGGTELVLTHEGLPDENSRGQHEHGWTGCLDKLEGLLK